jgi:hypothetical protein
MPHKITVSKQNRGKLVHLEAPGCIVNIRVDLHDAEGREVTAIEIIPDGPLAPFGKFSGATWRIVDRPHAAAVNIRVRKEK